MHSEHSFLPSFSLPPPQSRRIDSSLTLDLLVKTYCPAVQQIFGHLKNKECSKAFLLESHESKAKKGLGGNIEGREFCFIQVKGSRCISVPSHIHPSTQTPILPSILLSIHSSIHLPTNSPLHLPVHPSTLSPTHLCTHPSIYPFTHPSRYVTQNYDYK